MKLGIFSAAFPQWSLEQFTDWAAASGFETVELACWPQQKADRRYAGVTTLDVATLDQELVDDDTTLVINHWRFVGTGWITAGDAVLAAEASAKTREYDASKRAHGMPSRPHQFQEK